MYIHLFAIYLTILAFIFWMFISNKYFYVNQILQKYHSILIIRLKSRTLHLFNLCMHTHTHTQETHTCAMVHMWTSEENLLDPPFSPSTMWILRIWLRSSGVLSCIFALCAILLAQRMVFQFQYHKKQAFDLISSNN